MTAAQALSRYLNDFKIKIPNHKRLVVKKYKRKEVMTDGVWEKMRN